MWPFRQHHPHHWITIPTIIQRGTYRGADVLWMRDRYGKFFDALMFVVGEDVEVYTPYRHWMAME